MIEIITHKVEMPEISERRYQKETSVVKNKWVVKDTTTGEIVYRNSFENVCLACHNLNKKFYDTATGGRDVI